ncbi:hypothetical protein ACFONN_04575 [Dyella humi]|uniref:Uncharacterized protein n=1 Tax=Dyella humi TaxID=1770547 RepID=A0ABW8IGV2_9GAMM
MVDLKESGLDPTLIERRIRFLLERAEVHLRKEGQNGTSRSEEMACAGTLWRDAACLAMLLENEAQARELLQRAGEAWANIGLFAGYALLHLSGITNWAENYTDDLRQAAWILRQSESTGEQQESDLEPSFIAGLEVHDDFYPKDGTPERRAYLSSSSVSKRQLLNLLQAAANVHHGDDLKEFTNLIRSRFERTPSATLEGIRLLSYVYLLDTISHGEFGEPQQNLLTMMALNRRERLAAAQGDSYHWERILNPAFIVDLDLFTLCGYAVEKNLIEQFNAIMEFQPALVSLPWTVAQRLYSQPAAGPTRDYF